MMKRLFFPVPFYVTRPTADGTIASFTVAAVFGVAASILVVANIIVWSVVGLVAAAGLL
jgi:hypothetical protein